ncbi:hypothetical protein CAPTEDRAFT_174096 [Capitella teleta]|uniref:DDB1- and CUL4-associated factor 13 n=2 Tax=Capitella teleta TaxID=283909 RepID=R7UL77_CAPTE|nr:hypothetical protein CAPTEDRAFT_174096 [Capitella teleta]|eukprot:ELU03992.1 hypothetical protein CAPTEDRAFT_174096 [Capitella teleta]
MKIKVLSRNPDDYIRETKKDIHRVPRNYDPNLHPFETPREYTRAVNAVKLEKVFSKPFIGDLDGHKDVVECMCKHPTQLSHILSGAGDGEVKLWDLPRRKCVRSINAHDGFVRGICFNPSGEYFFTCGSDKVIKQWSMDGPGAGEEEEPMNTILSKNVFHSIDHHWQNNTFATCSDTVDVWDETRAEPVRSYQWGVDSIYTIKYNPIETHLLAGTADDRSIIMYDTRGSVPLRRVRMKLKSNAIAWNPMEAYMFTVASEDYNLYSFDARYLDKPTTIHQSHVAAVMDVDYSPTGKEFVSGSYDKTLRIFAVGSQFSREVYHTRRMQIVQCVRWSHDDRYLLSGSDEMNLRLWKARAAEKIGRMKPREKEAMRYNDKLKEKFAQHPQVKRIAKYRHVPKRIMAARKEHTTIRSSQKRKYVYVFWGIYRKQSRLIIGAPYVCYLARYSEICVDRLERSSLDVQIGALF